MSDIKRIYVEKKAAFAVEAKGLLADLRNNSGFFEHFFGVGHADICVNIASAFLYSHG